MTSEVLFRKRLAELEASADDWLRPSLIDELQEAAPFARLDAEELNHFAALVERYGFPLRPGLAPTKLQPGESLVLLYHRGNEKGHVRTLAVSFDVTASCWSEDSSLALDHARRGLRAALRMLGREEELSRKPIELRRKHNDIDLRVEGRSLGLSACMALVSRELGRPPARDVAGSAVVDRYGKLKRVEHLNAKIDALRRSWPSVDRVIVARDQPPCRVSGVDLVPCDTLVEALEVADLALTELDCAPSVLSASTTVADQFRKLPPELRMQHDADVLVLADRVIAFSRTIPELAELERDVTRLLSALQGESELEVAAIRRLAAGWTQALMRCGADRSSQLPNEKVTPKIVVASLLSPLAEARANVTAFLRRLVLHPWSEDDVQIDALVRSIADEHARHVQRFVGREEILDQLSSQLAKPGDNGRYVVVTAAEGYGKSALMAKFSDALSQSRGYGCGASTAPCSWIPAALLHHGKWDSNPHRVIRSLVAQGNMLLLDPIPSPVHPTSDDEQRWLARLTTASSAVRGKPISEDDTLSFVAVLRALVHERGEGVVVIDALDEMMPDRYGSILDVLPESLPIGATVILATRPEPDIMAMLAPLEPIELQLKGLDTREVGLITGSIDESWNRTVCLQTEGRALFVADAAEQLKKANGDVRKVVAADLGNRVFSRHADLWWPSRSGQRSHDPLWRTLEFLSVLEPVSPVSLEHIEDYLRSVKIPSAMFEITRRNLLDLLERHVATQLEGLAAQDRIKLAFKSFGEYTRTIQLGSHRVATVLDDVRTWIASDPTVDPALVARFLIVWSSKIDDVAPKHLTRWQATMQLLVDNLAKQEDAGARLYQIFDAGAEAGVRAPTIMVEVLKRAAQLRNPNAMRRLGNRLLDDVDGISEFDEGKRWLYAAADVKDPKAMYTLGLRLSDGTAGIEQDVESGHRYIRAAADAEDLEAMTTLGLVLLDGELMYLHAAPNTEDGERYLRRAADANHASAMMFLGLRLLHGCGGIKLDVMEGERYLRAAAHAKDARAMMNLGIRLLDGDAGIKQDVAEGEHYLRAAAEAREPGAMKQLGVRLLERNGRIERDVKEGERYLRMAADAKEPEAMLLLGRHLLEADQGIERNVMEGERYLREAADASEPVAMMHLGLRLLEGFLLKRDVLEGERYLRAAADAKEPEAMMNLGILLLDGDYGIERNVAEGARYLRAAADARHPRALRYLGARLFHGGHGVDQEIDTGARLLQEAADGGDAQAMHDVGLAFLRGVVGFGKNLSLGVRYLRQAAEANHSAAMTEFGAMLLDGSNEVERDTVSGERYLRAVAESKHLPGMVELGLRLLDGNGLSRNAESGVQCLQTAESTNPGTLRRFAEELLATPNPTDADLVRAAHLLDAAVLAGDQAAHELLADVRTRGPDQPDGHETNTA